MRLNVEQSEEFARRLFYPTREEIERHNRILTQIEQDVIITRNETSEGFTATCKNLDLSFLDELN